MTCIDPHVPPNVAMVCAFIGVCLFLWAIGYAFDDRDRRRQQKAIDRLTGNKSDKK